jgi:1-acyl-sn-glycerol-3-phosphate acyltransferase
MFNFEYDAIDAGHSPYIVISNHLTNFDPLLIGLSFRKLMYYVASDHVLRSGFKGKLLNFLMSPIARAKTMQETQTVITIFRRLKENCNICIFAEGTTSFDGETGEVQRSIGKLVKRAGVALVTYRFTGSYFTFPRWARFIHRGRMQGRLVCIYSPEKIASMTEDEIYDAIMKDIYANAYAEQEKSPVMFRGKKPAEYLETVLYCCPECRQFSTLKSRDDTLFCKCGFKVRYNESGYFETPGGKEPPPLASILDWAKWQRQEINALAVKMENFDINTPVFTDDDQQLFQIARASHNTLIAKGKLTLFKDRLSVIEKSGKAAEFPLDNIADIGIITMMTIIFSTNENKVFEVHSKHPRSALKYMELFRAIKKLEE